MKSVGLHPSVDMEHRHVNIEVGGKTDKEPQSLSLTLNPCGYDTIVKKDELAECIAELKRYVREEIDKIPKCKCDR